MLKIYGNIGKAFSYKGTHMLKMKQHVYQVWSGVISDMLKMSIVSLTFKVIPEVTESRTEFSPNLI